MESREDNSSDDKTEEATDERRNQFREEGNIANPREIVAASVLVFFTSYFYLNGANIFAAFKLTLERAFFGFHPREVTASNLVSIIYYIVEPNIYHLIIIFLICIILPVFVGFLFTRFNFTLNKFKLDLNKINPLPGIMKIFSLN